MYKITAVSAIVCRGHFGTVPFSLTLVPDCLYGIHYIFSVGSLGNPLKLLLLLLLLLFIVESYETLIYANILSVID